MMAPLAQKHKSTSFLGSLGKKKGKQEKSYATIYTGTLHYQNQQTLGLKQKTDGFDPVKLDEIVYFCGSPVAG